MGKMEGYGRVILNGGNYIEGMHKNHEPYICKLFAADGEVIDENYS